VSLYALKILIYDQMDAQGKAMS